MQRKKPKIENGVAYWKCSTCQEYMPGTEFYSDNRKPNKLKSQCKKCHMITNIKSRDPENTKKLNREYMRRARKSSPEKFKKRDRIRSIKDRRDNPEKIKIRSQFNHALQAGKIIKPIECSRCGNINEITAHHPDYSKPLDVIWLCHKCHGETTVNDRLGRGV